MAYVREMEENVFNKIWVMATSLQNAVGQEHRKLRYVLSFCGRNTTYDACKENGYCGDQ